MGMQEAAELADADSMSAAALQPDAVFRRDVTFVVLPQDLARLHGSLTTWFAEMPEVEVLVERRAAERSDRRRLRLGAPGGQERRQGDRRVTPWLRASATELGLELPWTLTKHADRIGCVRRSVPVRREDAALEADALFARAKAGDGEAREELRMRFHPWVHAMVAPVVGRRRALEVTDAIFDEAFAGADDGQALRPALTLARERVLAS